MLRLKLQAVLSMHPYALHMHSAPLHAFLVFMPVIVERVSNLPMF